ncbi:MAG: hypothetical protein E7265_06275 [Lachnospiraceae bacterium]|nr:hypothetical protein [Lachnospiraceae bacterium]
MVNDYNKYEITVSEIIRIIIMSVLLDAGIVYMFYKSMLVCLVAFAPCTCIVCVYRKKKIIESRKDIFENQFEEFLGCLSSALSAGYSLENAIFESVKELSLMYTAQEDIMRELKHICKGIEVNKPVEHLFLELSKKTDIAHIKTFADMVVIAKRSGGNLVAIVRQTIDVLHSKRNMITEIKTMIAAKRYECRLMNLLPLMMLVFLSVSSPGYLDPLYGNLMGIIVMTICLVIYGVSVVISNAIMSIGDNEKRIKPDRTFIKNVNNVKNKSGNRLYTYMYRHGLREKMNQIKFRLKAVYIGNNKSNIEILWWDRVFKNTFVGVAGGIVVSMLCYFEAKEQLPYVALLTAALVTAVPYSQFNKLRQDMERRNRQLIMDYPDVINRYILLLGSGINMRGVWQRMCNDYSKVNTKHFHYVYEEMQYSLNELSAGMPEVEVYERFGRRIGLLPYMKLCTMLSQNLKKGNKHLIEQLRVTSIDAIQDRRDTVKRLGEEASSKLLLPMMLQFLLILIIVMYPALISM